MKKFPIQLLLTTTTLSLSGTALATETAQESGPNSFDEIIVTAQKRSERLSDVPLSVTAASGAQLARQNITSAADLERIVPGFSYQQSSYGPPVFSIRGIGVYDTFVGMSPTVTVYVDQVPLPYLAMAAGASVDLERVEVLKGPQGTLFGQNATGGAINYIAAKPTREMEAGLDLTYGRFNQFDGQVFVSGPLSDTVRARLVVRHEGRGGWQRSLSRPGDKLGDRDFTTARLLLDWEPNDRVTFSFNANGWLDKSETQAAQFVEFAPAVPNGAPISLPLADYPVAPKDPRAADWIDDHRLKHDDSMGQLSLRIDYRFDDDTTLTSISSYAHYKANATLNTDGTRGIDVMGSFVPNFLMNPHAVIDSTSQELRLAGEISGIKYTLGGNYQHDTIDYVERLIYNGSNSGATFPWGTFFNNRQQNINYQHIETASGFANLEYPLLPQLTITGAMRYSYQWRRFHGCTADGGDGAMAEAFYAPIPGNSMAAPGECITWTSSANPTRLPDGVRNSLNEDNVSWRAGLNWKPGRNTLIYANATKGYKSGSFTPLPAVVASQLAPVTQESVLAYEIGAKTSLLNNHIQLSGAAFHYDYRNKQILGYKVIDPFGPLPSLQNVPKGKVDGFELELTLRPLRGLRLSSGLSYVDSQVDGSASTFNPYGVPIDINGEKFPNAPTWQSVTDAQYDFSLSGGLNAYLGASVNARSHTYAAFGENPNFRIDGYALVGLRAGLESANGHWRAQIWGNNVGNKFYVINVSHLTDTVARTTGMPATYGVTLSFRY
ncbi:MAG: TonB-dependent receptor [Sphingobium sp.]